MDVYEVAMKLIGHVAPVGETNEDNRRFDNLKELCDVMEVMMTDLHAVARYKNYPEYSRKRAGEYADKFLKNLTEELEANSSLDNKD